jgi:hypothetical protein
LLRRQKAATEQKGRKSNRKTHNFHNELHVRGQGSGIGDRTKPLRSKFKEEAIPTTSMIALGLGW